MKTTSKNKKLLSLLKEHMIVIVAEHRNIGMIFKHPTEGLIVAYQDISGWDHISDIIEDIICIKKPLFPLDYSNYYEASTVWERK